jgi:hypothetical protein
MLRSTFQPNAVISLYDCVQEHARVRVPESDHAGGRPNASLTYGLLAQRLLLPWQVGLVHGLILLSTTCQRRVDRVAPAKAIRLHNGRFGETGAFTQSWLPVSTTPLFAIRRTSSRDLSSREVPLRGHELVHSHRCPSTGGGALLVAYVADAVVVPAHDQSIGSPR